MHFEILVEDKSGKKALDVIVPKIVDSDASFKIHSYKGIGRIPKSMKIESNPRKRMLLSVLPRLLKGYGKTFANWEPSYPSAVIVVCDLDDKDCKAFKSELLGVLDRCIPRPTTAFCIAIEEGEAWLLGDVHAVKSAYPHANLEVLDSYSNDEICGTWEKLADAVFPGGSKALALKGWQAVGREKMRWAEKITPHMDIDGNKSPSFLHFKKKIRELVKVKGESGILK